MPPGICAIEVHDTLLFYMFYMTLVLAPTQKDSLGTSDLKIQFLSA